MEKYACVIEGRPPGLLMHNIDGGFVESSALAEQRRLQSLAPKAKKEPANVQRMRDIEWHLGLYLDGDGMPTLPAKVLRATIVGGAKITRDGKRVQRGLQVRDVVFSHPFTGMTADEMCGDPAARLESVVNVQRQRVLRVRPLFPEWRASFMMVANPEQVNEGDLRNWITTAGDMIGAGDWRIEKGGEYGGFELVELAQL